MADKKQSEKFTAVKLTKETNSRLKIYCIENGLLMYPVADKAINEYLDRLEQKDQK